MFRKIILMMTAVLAVPAFALDIVKDGKPAAQIVLAKNANPSERIAAKELQEHFELISGAKVPIVSAPTPEYKNKIYVGISKFIPESGFDLSAVENGGYHLLVKDKYAIVAGRDRLSKISGWTRSEADLDRWRKLTGYNFELPAVMKRLRKQLQVPGLDLFFSDDTGTWYGACDLLRQLGCRWYSWTDVGTVIPQMSNISLKKQDIVRKPKFVIREFYSWSCARVPEIQKWLHRNGAGNSLYTWNNHTLYDIANKDMLKEYPEIFARNKYNKIANSGGARLTAKLSNPKLREMGNTYLDCVFKSLPELAGMSLGMPDGFRPDYQDRMKFEKKGKDAVYANKYSNYVWDFWHPAALNLKNTHPDKFLTCMAYAAYQYPPDNTSLVSDNVIVTHVYNVLFFVSWMFPEKKRQMLEAREKWFKLLKPGRYQVWLHYLFHWNRPSRIYSPAFCFKAQQEDMKFLADHGALGHFIEAAGMKDYPALTHMFIWWQAQLFWNPGMSRDKAFNEYFRLYYGPAENEMKEFFRVSEARFTDPNQIPLYKRTAAGLKAYNDKYFELLEAAKAKTAPDSVYRKRIELFEKEMSPLKKQYESLKRTGPLFRIFLSKKPIGLDKSKYSPWRPLSDLDSGEVIRRNKTMTAWRFFKEGKKRYLHIMAICNTADMKGIRAACKKDDDHNIFNDDHIEIFLISPERGYFKIAVNSNGAIWDETTDSYLNNRDTTPLLWNPGTRAKVKKYNDRWEVEVSIPTDDFGETGPSKKYPWGLQIGRSWISRDNAFHNQALCPTGAGFAKISKWANIWFR